LALPADQEKNAGLIHLAYFIRIRSALHFCSPFVSGGELDQGYFNTKSLVKQIPETHAEKNSINVFLKIINEFTLFQKLSANVHVSYFQMGAKIN